MGDSLLHVVIVGGGISGLSTAFALQEACQQTGRSIACTVVEGNPTWGGKIVTNHVRGLVIEGGPDSFLTAKPGAMQLCEKLGLTPSLINTNEANSQTFAYSRGQLCEIPQGLISFVPTRIGPLLSSGLLSWPGILRMGVDWFLPNGSRDDHDESLASFFRRRLGNEAFDRLIEPLVAGIYAGDAAELSMKATFPRFLDVEQQHGGLIKGMLAQRSKKSNASQKNGPKRTMFATLQGGLGDLVSSLVKRLESSGTTLLSGRHVKDLQIVQHKPHPYQVVLYSDEVLAADSVVLATPSFVSAQLLQGIDPQASTWLKATPYASTATISLAYRSSDIEKTIRGFGFVIPRIEGKQLIAATWTSLKWPYRAQSGDTLIRCYAGGNGRDAILENDDDSLIKYVRDELQNMVGIKGSPLYAEVYRWDQGMPQYTSGHLDRLHKIRTALLSFKGLYLTGAGYEGIGIPDCIQAGTRTAEELLEAFPQGI